ncbi:MAG: hypothetical protein ACF8CQ_24135, partial [Rhodopirellula sp. JB044]|uniref:hypothetical protein n=1 Tax=Rhodopirellula sp. JB044 TaxID=3342844 RepID=UPI00370CC5CA
MGKTRLGLKGKVYLSTEGTFNAIKVARDQITLNLSKSEADVTPHGSEWELFRGAVKAAEVSFQMLDKTDDTVVAAILDSFLNGTPLELKVLNGAEDAEGVSGLHAAFEVF